MESDGATGLLSKLASGSLIESESWPELRDGIITRLEKVARDDFPIPKLPPPPTLQLLSDTRLLSPLPSSPLEHPSSQEADKENAPAEQSREPQHLEPGELPKQLASMLDAIKSHLRTFSSYPPHTIQRLAELVLNPRSHYKALASYLHAVDRVVQVTSTTNAYPLPPAVADLSSLGTSNDDTNDPADKVSWSNPTLPSVGSDEALGGALLTPIPWLAAKSPETNGSSSDTSSAKIHSESTETISGPNGMGRVETVSVSVNGVPSTGHTRGVTQGELLRQEQRAGVVPVSQLSRPQEDQSSNGDDGSHPADHGGRHGEVDEESPEEEEAPHARGPEDIGVDDLGPQGATTSHFGEGGSVNMQSIDVEAAVGRKHGDEDHVEDNDKPSAEGKENVDTPSDIAGSKREADGEPEGAQHTKKLKEDEDDTAATKAEPETDSAVDASPADAEAMETTSDDPTAKEERGGGDAMDTDDQA